MIKWIIPLMFIASSLFAQKTISLTPDEDNGQYKYTALDSGTTVTKNFYFSQRTERHGYNGYVTVYVFTDSALVATQTVATFDSLTVNAYVLIYDEISQAWEQGITGLLVSGKDLINVLDEAAWGTGHSDAKYTASKVLNLQSCDGVRLVASAMSDLIYRVELKFNQGID